MLEIRPNERIYIMDQLLAIFYTTSGNSYLVRRNQNLGLQDFLQEP